MSAAKTPEQQAGNARRQREFRDRRAASDLAEVRGIWLPATLHEELRCLAAMLGPPAADPAWWHNQDAKKVKESA